MIMRRSKFLYFLVIFFITFACHEQGTNQRENKAFKEELKSRELKRATEAEISNAAYQQGSLIADMAQNFIDESLSSNDSIRILLTHYKEALLVISDSLTQQEDIDIQRLSTQNNAPDSMESLILDAYLYNIEQKLRVEDNIQEIGKAYFLYTRPIIIDDKTCIRCHGEIGQDLLETDEKYLKKHHPKIPTGYKQGDFMGMWSIKMSRRAIIRAL